MQSLAVKIDSRERRSNRNLICDRFVLARTGIRILGPDVSLQEYHQQGKQEKPESSQAGLSNT